MKANFSEIPERVKVCTTDGMQYVFLALNPIEKIKDDITFYEVDYNEIAFPIGKLDINAIVNDPEKYINYVYADKTPTSTERLEALEMALLEVLGEL